MISFASFFLVANLLLKPTQIAGFKLLLLGDSIDRMAVNDWCTLKQTQGIRANLTTSWCEEYVIGRESHKWHCFSCQTDEDVIASVHLYGSGDIKPYHYSEANDIYESTTIRLPLMIAKFISTHGLPDRVMYHTNQWDSRCGDSNPWFASKTDDLFRMIRSNGLNKFKKFWTTKLMLGWELLLGVSEVAILFIRTTKSFAISPMRKISHSTTWATIFGQLWIMTKQWSGVYFGTPFIRCHRIQPE